jgi:hypothetical protein
MYYVPTSTEPKAEYNLTILAPGKPSRMYLSDPSVVFDMGRDRDLGLRSGPTGPDQTERTDRETKFYVGLSVLHVELYHSIFLRTCTHNKVLATCILHLVCLLSTFLFLLFHVLCIVVLLFCCSRALDTYFED